MIDLLFLMLLGLYVYVAINVVAWRVISALGFMSETPLGFIERPGWYILIQSGIFLSTIATAILSDTTPWHISMPAILLVWIGAPWLGRRKAFETFRQIHCDMIKYDDSLMHSDLIEYQRITQEPDYANRRANLEEYSKKTNKEILALLRLLTKYKTY
jgi:hypothetical protein